MTESSKRTTEKELSSSAGDAKSKRFKLLLRVGISLACILVIYGSADLGKLWRTIRSIPGTSAVLLLLLYAAGQVLSAFKWQIFIDESRLHRPIREVVRAYWLGMFFNTFGLGTVGGDLARALALRPRKGERAVALATVVADRIHGLSILLVVGATAALVFHPAHLDNFAMPVSLGMLALLGGVYWFGPVLLVKVFPEGHRFGSAAALAASAFPKRTRPFITASVISAIFHLSQILIHWFIARDLGLNLSFGFLAATVPLVNIACSFPISINGLGVREGMYILLFGPAGVDQESAIAIGAIWIVIVTLVSAFGGLIADRVILNDIADEQSDEAERKLNGHNHELRSERAIG